MSALLLLLAIVWCPPRPMPRVPPPPEPCAVTAADLVWFPSADAADDGRAFARAAATHWRHNAAAYPWTEWSRLETEWEDYSYCLQCWEELAAAHDARERGECRDHLTRLRDLLGPRDYLAGHMPPYVPFWRFRRFP